jgi:hypothetical protein
MRPADKTGIFVQINGVRMPGKAYDLIKKDYFFVLIIAIMLIHMMFYCYIAGL